MLLPPSVDDNVVTCHSAEHPCGASALRGLHGLYRYTSFRLSMSITTTIESRTT